MAANSHHRWSLATAIVVVSVMSILLSFSRCSSPPEPVSVIDSIPEPDTPQYEFGLPLDSFEIYEGEIGKDQFLADILLRYGVTYPEITRLVKAADSVFDVRKIRAGKDYTIFCARDSTGKAQYFVYQPSPVDYIVFDLCDTVNVYKGKKEIVIEENEATGVVQSSLYQTLEDQDMSPVLALELADIFAWTIDFYRIQKGDQFKVIYEEGFVEGQSIGIGKIKTAVFRHWDEDYYAFWYMQDSVGDYFDEKAKSLQKAFLKMPLKYGRLSSSYSLKRFHPVQKRYKAHLGTDYSAPTGTPILATGNGTVIESGYKKYNGNYVKILHSSSYTTQYLHMSKRAAKAGQAVKQGDVIGYVGSTGLSTGPHVCYRFWKNDKQVDHRREKFPPSKPIKKELLENYFQTIVPLQKRLDSLRIL